MKRLLYAAGICLFVLCFAGCNNSNANLSRAKPREKSTHSTKLVPSKVEGEDLSSGLSSVAKAKGEAKAKEDKFPSFLVGTWKSDDGKWAFTFEPDGSISTMRHFFISVPVNVKEGRVDIEGRENAHFTYVLGPCIAKYHSENHILNVDINIDYFEVVLPIGTAEGSMIDNFNGVVSQVMMRWNAEWINYTDIVSFDKTDPNSLSPEEMVFRHVEEK